METTSLYVELIIIGLETSMWLASSFLWVTDICNAYIVAKMLDKLPASILLLGLMYVIGIIIDRFADMIFKKKENIIRKESGLKSKSSIVIWTKSKQEEYFKFTRSKVRILRASIINIPLFTVSAILCIIKYMDATKNYQLILFAVICGIFFSWFSYKGYKEALTNYYNKAKILEDCLIQEPKENLK